MSLKSGNNPGKRKRPSFFYAILSVTLVLFVLGFFGLAVFHGQKLLIFFKEQVNLLVEIKNDAEELYIAEFQEDMIKMPFVKEGSVIYTNKEEAVASLREDFGEDVLQFGLTNPFYDILSFNVKAEFMNTDSLYKIKKQLLSIPIVNDVFYQESFVDKLEDNINRIGLIGLVVSVLFVIIAFALIHNTIKLAMYSNRFLIKNMELVGASWEFITRPYLIRGFLYGLFSALLAIGGLMGILYFFYREFPDLVEIRDNTSLFFLFLLLILIGVLITTLSTFYTVSKYLKMRLEDLY